MKAVTKKADRRKEGNRGVSREEQAGSQQSASSPGCQSNCAAKDIDWQTSQKPCNHVAGLISAEAASAYMKSILPLYAAEPAPAVPLPTIRRVPAVTEARRGNVVMYLSSTLSVSGVD